MTNQNKQTPKLQLRQTAVICCDFFKENIKEFGWFKSNNLAKEQYLMPYVLGTKIRINYCPTCGKECRDTILSSDLYHSL